MHTISHNRIISGLYHLHEPFIILANTDEIVFANELSKPLLEVDDDGEYRLPYINNVEWPSFLNRVRKQNNAIVEHYLPINSFNIKYVTGFLNGQKEIVLIFYFNDNQQVHVEHAKVLLPAMDFLDIGMVLVTSEGIIADVNTRIGQIIGYDPTYFLAKNIGELKKYFSYDKSELRQMLFQLERTDEGTLIVKKVAKEIAYYELKIKYNPADQMYYLSLFEHTEYMAMQAQLKEQQFLKEIGMMSATIAHEIRNPLAALKGFTDLLKSEARTDQQPYFDIMEHEFEYLDAILTDLLYLSRPRVRTEQSVDLLELINEVIDFLQPEVNIQHIVLELEIEQHQPFMVRGNAVRLRQVFINLLKNAMQATQYGMIIIRLIELNGYIQVSIQDEGRGMPEDVRKNVFTPFYTTKEGGTGLGLSLVKKIIEDVDGFIEVESHPNIGTSFLMTFPHFKISTSQ